MNDYPMLDRHGNLIPELADYLRGARLVPDLAARGIVMNQDRAALVELGRALREADPDPGPDLDQMVEQIQARNRETVVKQAVSSQVRAHAVGRDITPGLGMGMDHRPPNGGKSAEPNLRGPSDGNAHGAGRTDSASAEDGADPVPFEENIPDEEWSS
jgi:hypothetical protein